MRMRRLQRADETSNVRRPKVIIHYLPLFRKVNKLSPRLSSNRPSFARFAILGYNSNLLLSPYHVSDSLTFLNSYVMHITPLFLAFIDTQINRNREQRTVAVCIT